MIDSGLFMIILLVGSFITIIVLSLALSAKMDKITELKNNLDKLKSSLDEMDEQAKLIVRTDMELNKTQEELDKKITGLYSLQRLSRAITTTLEESQIFRMIEPNNLEELGFEKSCAFLWNDGEGRFLPVSNIGYSNDEAASISLSINSHKDDYLGLIQKERTLSSLSIGEKTGFELSIPHIFKVASFVLSPILPKEGNKGFLLVGTESKYVILNEGDEELITILANQLGQALDNARLFDKTWRSQQELEQKVRERTSELTRALNELRNVSKRKTDFVSSVSHELRTPLTSIKGYASILLAGKLGAIPNEIRERLDKINRHSDELVHMINDLLDISRIESGKIPMKREAINLKETVEKVTDLLSIQLKERSIDLGLNIPDGANHLSADRSQIERVFINIIGNALKFTPQRGKITVNSHKSDDGIQVDIADTGCGIPQDALESIFEEFYRVENPVNQEVKGTGLGLALVKHIIEAHNGKIWVKSKIGAGSVFSFIIPEKTINGG